MPPTETGNYNKAIMRVYLVEKSEIIRLRLALLLVEIEGLELVGQSASAVIAGKDVLRLHPDMVLIDIKLPDGNGLDLLAAMQEQGLESMAIIMTYSPYQQYRKRAMELGAVCFIDKASNFEGIQLTLKRMIAEQCEILKVA